LAEQQGAVAKVAHEISTAAWFGGSLFGKFVLNPAVRVLDSESDRGKMLNNAWARYKLVNALASGVSILSWTLGVRPDLEEVSDDVRTAVITKDALLGLAAASSLGVSTVGARFSARAPGGAVPVRSGTRPSRRTPRPAARDQTLLGALDNVELLALLGVLGLTAALNRVEELRV
jgi:hypothetical protein